MTIKNQHGVTLIELLATILILSLIVVPLSTYLLTGTYTRTISQAKENQLLYFAQEIMETIRQQSTNNTFDTKIGQYKGTCSLETGCEQREVENPEATFEIIVTEYPANSKFVEVKVTVSSSQEMAATVELVTVVKKHDTT